jgi:molybdate transport system substrate-binding protein
VKKAIAATAACILGLSACATSAGTAGGRREELLVFAAASLTEAFREIGANFEAEHAGVAVVFNFGPSDGLATQIISEGTADVFASASPRWMDAVAQDGPGVSGREDFARNRLVVIVPEENPAAIDDIGDLANPGVRLVLAAEDVPVGAYAREALTNAGIAAAAQRNLVSNEQDVKGVVQKVILGEADAGIVYITDVTPDLWGTAQAVEIPEEINVVATYPIAVVRGTDRPGPPRDFVAFVLGPGQEVLGRHGFEPIRP